MTPKQEQAIALRHQGFTYEQIAEMVGYADPRNVRESIYKYTGRLVPRRTTRVNQALALRRQGIPFTEIAQQLGYSSVQAVKTSLANRRYYVKKEER